MLASGSVRPPDILIGTIDVLAERAAAEFVAAVNRAAGAGRHARVAVPGGSVARAFFPRFSRLDVEWDRLDVFFVDERAVPPHDPSSNVALARTLWFTPARLPDDRVHPMFDGTSDLEAAASAYAATLARVAGVPLVFDLVLLGIGADGHIASLFPGRPSVDETRPVTVELNAPAAPPRRLTMTLPVLAAAGRVIMAAFGAGKRDAVAAALHPRSEMSPAAVVTRHARSVLWLLDPDAAPQAISAAEAPTHDKPLL
jgi:6-phosphogluconolactonase